jgi:hypothetical protein
MTSRERWTVYPLLFLAIGLAIRAAVLPPERFDAARIDTLEAVRVSCREIVVEADDGTVLIHMGRVIGDGGGRIEIKDRQGIDAIAIGTQPNGRAGVVECYDETGQPADCQQPR